MQYRTLLLLALSLGLTATIAPTISLAKPAATTIAANSDRLTAPKLIPRAEDTLSQNAEQDLAYWLKKETETLSQPHSLEKYEALMSTKRAIQAYLMENGVAETIPSKAAIAPLANLAKRYPQSLMVAVLSGESQADGASDAQIERIFTDLSAKQPQHSALMLLQYGSVIRNKYDGNLPAPIATKLNLLLDREIAKQPQNVFLYAARAELAPNPIEAIFTQWQIAETKINQPIVALMFGRGILGLQTQKADQKPDPKVMAQLLQRLETAIQQHPQELKLYTFYTEVARKANLPTQKLLPIYQAGLSKGANPQMLNYFMGDAYLFSGQETQALSQYQKVIQGKMSLCIDEMDELLEPRFNAFKRPENKRAMLNLIMRSMTVEKPEWCTGMLSDIGFKPETGKQFSQDIITGLLPIARTSPSFDVRSLLLGLMRDQKQYAEIVKLGPELLPANGASLSSDEYWYARMLPVQIAEAYENLGNLDQAAKFYNLFSDYARSLSQPEFYYQTNHINSWNLGRLAWKGGKADQAIKLLQSITADQRMTLTYNDIAYRALAHNLLGEIFQSQGKKAEAKREFEAAVKVDEKFQTAKDNLAKLK
jgi:lipopolysaccharide biosynthesis regulator YciM